MNPVDFTVYFASFFALWLGSGLIISSIDKFSKRLKMSSFTISFFFLGLMTSIPEFAVGFTSIAQNDPEIFVGNLLGGVTVIFLFIIPILAILGNGVKLNFYLGRKTLALALFVIGAPALFILDSRITANEGVIFILLYIILFIFIQRKKGIFDFENHTVLHLRSYSPMDILKLLAGFAVVLISSRFAVDKTIDFANLLNISPLILSLIILSLGTNLPELSLAVRSVVTGDRDIAFGDYLGSAASNTLIFGILTLVNGGEVLTTDGFLQNFIFVTLALTLFYFFSKSERNISRKEGIIMILLYGVFATLQLAGS